MIVAAEGGALNTCHVELDRNYRFEAHPGISRLAAAIRQYDGDAAIETLTSTEYREELAHYASGQVDDALEQVWPHVMGVVRASDPDTALAALARVRILCALRRGRYGVEGIKARVEARLRREGRPAGEWTHGRPVLVTANDPHSGLFNGDVGVLLNRQDGRGVMAWFPSLQDPRSVPLAALPSHDTAWAMTVRTARRAANSSPCCAAPSSARAGRARTALHRRHQGPIQDAARGRRRGLPAAPAPPHGAAREAQGAERPCSTMMWPDAHEAVVCLTGYMGRIRSDQQR